MADNRRERRVIAEDDSKIVFETSEEVSVTPTFDSMKIREDLLRGIYAYGKAEIGKIKSTFLLGPKCKKLKMAGIFR